MKADERLAILRGLPKIELHRHLEGSLRLGTLLELGKRYGLDLPLDSETSLARLVTFNDDEPRTLANFLTKFRSDWYRSYKDIERVTAEAVRDAASEGIVHLELRFSPEHLTRTSGLQIEGALQAVCESGIAAAAEEGISIRFILTFARERYSYASWTEMVDLGVRMHEMGISGVDLAGDEFQHANREFERFFRRVRDIGELGITIHAGEGTSAEQVASAVGSLSAVRIGHGIEAARDDEVTAMLAAGRVTLEMCPISNFQTGCIDRLDQHPLPRLDRAGVPVTINADDPAIHCTSINDDYDVAASRWGYSLDDLLRLERNAVAAAFLPEEERAALLDRVERGYQESRGQGL
ncbi:MAG TPA: adenosine deaminase [Myxococcota bacterium]|nr:adenosine deaminase [Myxococcota bacterium]